MTIAQFRSDDGLFLYRVAGVAQQADRVLLHRAVVDDFWSLPGGRVHVGETAAMALVREMSEELAVEVEVGDMLWIIENFFRFRPLDMPADSAGEVPHHEIGMYLEMQLPDRLEGEEVFGGVELAGTVDEFLLEFRWFDRSEVADLDVRPHPLRRFLSQPLPKGTTPIVVLE